MRTGQKEEWRTKEGGDEKKYTEPLSIRKQEQMTSERLRKYNFERRWRTERV